MQNQWINQIYFDRQDPNPHHLFIICRLEHSLAGGDMQTLGVFQSNFIADCWIIGEVLQDEGTRVPHPAHARPRVLGSRLDTTCSHCPEAVLV